MKNGLFLSLKQYSYHCPLSFQCFDGYNFINEEKRDRVGELVCASTARNDSGKPAGIPDLVGLRRRIPRAKRFGTRTP
jgi:hypothetical protein